METHDMDTRGLLLQLLLQYYEPDGAVLELSRRLVRLHDPATTEDFYDALARLLVGYKPHFHLRGIDISYEERVSNVRRALRIIFPPGEG